MNRLLLIALCLGAATHTVQAADPRCAEAERSTHYWVFGDGGAFATWRRLCAQGSSAVDALLGAQAGNPAAQAAIRQCYNEQVAVLSARRMDLICRQAATGGPIGPAAAPAVAAAPVPAPALAAVSVVRAAPATPAAPTVAAVAVVPVAPDAPVVTTVTVARVAPAAPAVAARPAAPVVAARPAAPAVTAPPPAPAVAAPPPAPAVSAPPPAPPVAAPRPVPIAPAIAAAPAASPAAAAPAAAAVTVASAAPAEPAEPKPASSRAELLATLQGTWCWTNDGVQGQNTFSGNTVFVETSGSTGFGGANHGTLTILNVRQFRLDVSGDVQNLELVDRDTIRWQKGNTARRCAG